MYAKCFKRVIDFTLSLIALIILFPVLLILTVIGAIAMKGNPFFTQLRPGKIDRKTGKERIFRLIKFRTTTCEKDANGVLLPDKQRLNKYGTFLRNSSLDELPELLNILMGQMSIVGPRPLLVKYLPLYNDYQRQRHTVRPGLTGLAQVKGRNNFSWEQRFELYVEYVRKVTLLSDIRIILGTAVKVFKREGISSETCTQYTMAEFTGSKNHE
jgi:lipopolysaccharide/colanic/teichoic acid biosynthesis glycosyltransferase